MVDRVTPRVDPRRETLSKLPVKVILMRTRERDIALRTVIENFEEKSRRL